MTKKIVFGLVILTIGLGGGYFFSNFNAVTENVIAEDLSLDDQEATIRAIKKVIPAVVSILVYDYKDFIAINSPSGQKEIQKYRKQVGRSTGFLITADGFILTNKHVVEVANPDTGEYRIVLNSGKEYFAQIIGKDPINDLAVLKIFDKDLPFVELGDSDRLEIGTTVITIGNALGRYPNSASKGIVSGLGRTLAPSNLAESVGILDNVIQTDAQINPGNSGGPLVDLEGKVVGVNVALDSGGDIGFAISINDARTVIESVRESGRIMRPQLGVRYRMLTPEIATDNKLSRSTGAWVTPGDGDEPAVLVGSAAEKGGIILGDIIFEVNAIKIDVSNTLSSVIQKYRPRDKIGLKILRGDKVIIRIVQLGEFR